MDADHEDIKPAIDYFSKHKLQRHAFTVKNNFLCGLTFSSWLRLVWEHAHRIDWWPYAPRVLLLGALSALNSLLALPDRLLYGRRVAGARVNPAPVFVLGHPRTGTTHVHNLLSLDVRLGWADTLSAGFPSAFLSLGGALRRLAAPLLDSTRPMDAMALSFDTPAEDELAVCALSAGASPYMPLVLMRDQEIFRDLYALRGLLEGGESSPVHTARVRLLLRLFPDARFIYLHRDPYAVFASAAHMAESYYPFTALQRLEPADVARFVLDQFELLHETYQADRALIPPGRLVELGFAELDADPVAAMRRVYRELGWPDFERVLEPQLRAYAASLAGFKKNDHQRLPTPLRKLIATRWRGYFEAFGYPTHNRGDDAAPL